MFKPKYDSGTFITDYSATSHVVTTEENITNLCDAETQFTVGDSGTLTGTKLGNWHEYQKCYRQLHHATWSNTAIPGLHANLFRITRASQKGFQGASEGEKIVLVILLTFLRRVNTYRLQLTRYATVKSKSCVVLINVKMATRSKSSQREEVITKQ